MTAAALNEAPGSKNFQNDKSANLRIVSRSTFSDVTDLILHAVQEEVFPGAVVVVGKNGQEVYRQAAGYRCCRQEGETSAALATPELVYDIGSLTKQLVTTTILMRLAEAGRLKLDDRLVRHLQSFSVQGKSDVTVAHLLAHCSGLPASQPFYEELLRQNSTARLGIIASRGAREYIYNALTRSTLKYKCGTRELYSALGFIVLGNLLETLTGIDLARLARKQVFAPLGLSSTSFIDLVQIKQKGIQPVTDMIAPTEDCEWRGRVLCGEVHDENAWVMGGIAGHSGVFSCATDLHRFAQELLRAYHGQSSYLTARTVQTFWQTAPFVNGATWCLGWQRPTEGNDALDSGFSDYAVGHNSTTGCSLWIDPAQNLSIVLLSNRINPTRANRKIQEFRRQLFGRIVRSVQ